MDYLEYAKCFILIILLSVASVGDLRTKTISNKLVIVGSLIGILFTLVQLDMAKTFDAVMGAVISAGILLVISLITREGIGFGDVKLFACVGLFLGVGGALAALVISIMISGVAALILLLTKKVNKKTSIPFAPFILVGTLISIFL